MATLQQVMRDRLAGWAPLVTPEPGGLGFGAVYAKWLVDGDGPGAEPNAFNTAGRIKPAITVVLPGAGEVDHPSPKRPGIRLWDVFPSVYLFHWPSDHGKEILDQGKLEVESALMAADWQPVITGGQRPTFEPNTEVHLDNSEQFPGNYVIVLSFRVTGMRFVPVT